MLSRELVAASTRPLLLSLLAEGESYGYALIQRVKELSGGELNWTGGMLYPVLHRLEEEGLTSRTVGWTTKCARGAAEVSRWRKPPDSS